MKNIFNKKMPKRHGNKSILSIFYSLFIAIFVLCLFSSCSEDSFEQVIKIDLPEHSPKLVTKTHLIAGSDSIDMWVSHSLGTLDTATYPSIENASVQLFHNGSLLYDLPFSDTNHSYFTYTNSPLKAGDYRLEITAPDYEPIFAEQTLPTAVPINNVEYTKEGTISPDGERVNEIKVAFSDPSGEENFYEIRAYISFIEPHDSSNIHYFMPYLDSNDPLLEFGDEGPLLSDASFEGKDYTLILYHYDYFPENLQLISLRIELITITKDRYLYNKSLYNYWQAKDNPFAEPVVPHSNLEGGYGIFTLENGSAFVLEL